MIHRYGPLYYQTGASALLLLCLFLQTNEIHGMTTTGNVFVNKTSSHNDCENITTVGSFPFRVGGDTKQARMKMPLIIVENPQADPSCGQGSFSDYDIASPASWYMIEGKDHYVKAVVETADKPEQAFALFKGFDCGTELECVIGNAVEHRSNLLTWFAEKGTMYYFKVFGDPNGPDKQFVVNFMVRSEIILFATTRSHGLILYSHLQASETQRPSNDMCEYAQQIQGGESITGMTAGAWPLEIENEECNLGSSHSQAVFYSVQGTGKDIELVLQADVPEGKLGMAVVGGSHCNQCIAHSEYISASNSEQRVKFPSQKGTLYKVIVSGEEVFDAGLFHLTVLVSRHRVLCCCKSFKVG